MAETRMTMTDEESAGSRAPLDRHARLPTTGLAPVPGVPGPARPARLDGSGPVHPADHRQRQQPELPHGCPNPSVWMGAHDWSSNNLDRLARIPDAGTVSALRVVLEIAPGGGNSVTFTLRKDTGGVGAPVATALTCTDHQQQHDLLGYRQQRGGGGRGQARYPGHAGERSPTAGHVHYTTKYVSNTVRNTVLLGGSRVDPLIPTS